MEEPTLEQGQEQPEPEAKPKKGKLKLIIILSVVLAGGGFFAMKMKGGKAAKPELKLGKIAKIEEEFLVPLMGQGNYLRTNISFHLDKKADAKEIEEQMDAIRDAINMKLKSKYLKELEALDDIRALKKELAEEVNRVLESGKSEPTEAAERPKDEKAPETKDSKPKHPDWDSQTGPVLKVYFTTFATQ